MLQKPGGAVDEPASNTDSGPRNHPSTRMELVWLSAILLFSLALRCWHLANPPELVYDEQDYVPLASQLLAGQDERYHFHPPLGKLMIAASMRIWGELAHILPGRPLNEALCLSARAGSVLAGVIMIPMVYYLGRSMFGGGAGLIAAFLLAADFLHILMSRLAMLDIYQALFLLGATLCVWEYITREDHARRWLLLACLGFGCATAVKLSGLFSGLAALVCVFLLKPSLFGSPFEARARLLHCARLAGLGLAAVILVQIISYLPALRADHYDLALLCSKVTRQQAKMFRFHHSRDSSISNIPFWQTNGGHQQLIVGNVSACWQWPLLMRPVWLRLRFATPPGSSEGTSWVTALIALGSPWVWWSFLIVLFGLFGIAGGVARSRTEPLSLESKALLFCTVFYSVQLLAWGPLHGLFYYMLCEVPLMVLILGRMLQLVLTRPYGRQMVAGYLALTLLFLFFYWPLLTNGAIPKSVFLKLMLLPPDCL